VSASSAAAVRRRVAREVVDLRSAGEYVREGLGIGVFPATGIGEECSCGGAWPVERARGGHPL
jgi:hypothetical protein